MLKMVGSGKRQDGTIVDTVVLGLSKVNIKRLQEGKPIIFKGEDVRIPCVEFIIFAGDTEASMTRELEELIGPNTQTKIDPRTTDA